MKNREEFIDKIHFICLVRYERSVWFLCKHIKCLIFITDIRGCLIFMFYSKEIDFYPVRKIVKKTAK